MRWYQAESLGRGRSLSHDVAHFDRCGDTNALAYASRLHLHTHHTSVGTDDDLSEVASFQKGSNKVIDSGPNREHLVTRETSAISGNTPHLGVKRCRRCRVNGQPSHDRPWRQLVRAPRRSFKHCLATQSVAGPLR